MRYHVIRAEISAETSEIVQDRLQNIETKTSHIRMGEPLESPI